MNKWLPKIISVLSESPETELMLTLQSKGYLIDLWVLDGSIKKIAGCNPNELSHLVLDPDACLTVRRSVKDATLYDVDIALNHLIEASNEENIDAHKRQTVQVPQDIIERVRSQAATNVSANPEAKQKPETRSSTNVEQNTSPTSNTGGGASEKNKVEEGEPPARAARRKIELNLDGMVKDLWIGRGEDCSMPLLDDEASRKHCKIFSMGHTYFLEDNQSTNGTFVNGKRVETVGIQHGDLVQIGKTILVILVANQNNDSSKIPVANPNDDSSVIRVNPKAQRPASAIPAQ
ncbi:MAG: FHA domain-containing protein [Verrucomicrobiota bacterium]